MDKVFTYRWQTAGVDAPEAHGESRVAYLSKDRCEAEMLAAIEGALSDAAHVQPLGDGRWSGHCAGCAIDAEVLTLAVEG